MNSQCASKRRQGLLRYKLYNQLQYIMINLQELLALSTALSASLTAQIDFDSRQMKHCSTYNLAEGVDKDDGKARGIYQMDSEEYELAVTPKKPSRDV